MSDAEEPREEPEEEEEAVVVFRPGMTIEDMEREAISAALQEVDGRLPVTRLSTLEEHLGEAMATPRMTAWARATFFLRMAKTTLRQAALEVRKELSWLLWNRTDRTV